MRRPPRPSQRQMMLPLQRPAGYRPTEKVREEVVAALADLLLEAIGNPQCDRMGRRGENESEG